MHLHLDCFSGVSGDMFLGALLDVGVPLEELQSAISCLGIAGLSIERSDRRDPRVGGAQVQVGINEVDPPHRGLADVLQILAGGEGLSESVREKSAAVFRRLAAAEAEVHGVSVDEVHFHEVGALDAIADVVGTVFGLEWLGVTRLSCSPLSLGSGTVRCAHGELPVPVPATALLLRGFPTQAALGPQPTGELVTPTGAALVTTLCSSFGVPPAMEVERVAYGLGQRDRGDFPNALRIWLGRVKGEEAQEVLVIETTLDDVDPRVLGPLIGRLLGDGALDASYCTLHGKKGRPALGVTVLCPPELGVQDRIEQRLFRETTTLGLRYYRARRKTLPRRIRHVQTPYGSIPVKEGLLGAEVVTVQPEFEDCHSAAEAAGVSVRKVVDAARQAAAECNDSGEV